MAHQLDFKADVTAAMFSVRETPWHKLGTILQNSPSIEEALEQAGANFEVGLEPVYQQVSDGIYIPVEDARVVVRRDRGIQLGVVGSRYHCYQNVDGFNCFAPIIDNGIATIETAGVLRRGADVWILANIDPSRLSDKCKEVFKDEIKAYFLMSLNHSGKRPVIAKITPVRVVCANTLEASLHKSKFDDNGDSIYVRHTASVNSKMTENASRLLARIIKNFDIAAHQYEILQNKYLTMEQFETAVLNEVAPMTSVDFDAITNPNIKVDGRTVAAAERIREKRTVISRLWENGTGHDGERSAWNAYNAVVEAIDHDNSFGANSAKPNRMENRLESLRDGELSKVKVAVLNNLLAV